MFLQVGFEAELERNGLEGTMDTMTTIEKEFRQMLLSDSKFCEAMHKMESCVQRKVRNYFSRDDADFQSKLQALEGSFITIGNMDINDDGYVDHTEFKDRAGSPLPFHYTCPHGTTGHLPTTPHVWW